MNKFYVAVGLVFIIISSCSSQWSRRDKQLQPELVLDTIGIKSGMVIGEVGSGEGYLTFRLSSRVGAGGIIYANDIKKSVLETIRKKAKEEGVNNIETVLGKTIDPLFPVKNLDMVVMISVYHDLEKPVDFMQNLKQYLKPGTPVVIIDRDPDRWGQGDDHFMKKDELIDSVEKADYKLSRIETFPEIDNIYIFYPQ